MGEDADNKQVNHVVCQMVSSSFKKTQAGKGSAQVPLCVQGAEEQEQGRCNCTRLGQGRPH